MRRAERASSGGGAGGGVSSELSALSGGRLAFMGGGAAAGAGALIVAFGAAAKAGVEYKGSLDGLNRSFANLMGSQQAATAHLKELEQFTSRTPFEFIEVARASQRFQAMGIEAKKVVPILADIANAVAAVGGGQNEIDRVALAIAQVNAKGRVMTQEMNQLSEVGISGWKALELQTGKTREELMRMVEAGNVSADTFNQAFHRMYGDGKALEQQMETLGGSQARLTDEGRKLLSYAYTPLHDTLRDIVVEANKLRTVGWDTERMFIALGSASSGFINNFLPARMAGVTDTLDTLLTIARLRNAPPATPAGAPSTVNVPKNLQYKQRIPDEDLNKLQAAEFMRQKEQYVAESLRKQEEAERKVRQEAERQSEVLKRVGQDLAEAALRTKHFADDSLTLEKALYKLAIGYDTLTEANQRAADVDIEKQFKEKATQARLTTEKDFRKSLEEQIKSSTATLYGEKTAVEQLQEATRAFANEMGKGSSEAYKFDDAMMGLLRTLMGLSKEMDWVAQHTKMLNENRAAGAGFSSEDLLQPGKAVGTAQGPALQPLDLSNVDVSFVQTLREELAEAREAIPDMEATWRNSISIMAEDGSQIFADMFMRVGEGWKGMLGGLALDFTQMLQQMAAQALANQVWGALLNLAGKALGGVFNAGSSAHSALDAISHPGYAAGTPFASPGLHLVGERGPELVAFGGGERVFNNADSRKMLGGQTVVNNYNFNLTMPSTPASYTRKKTPNQVASTLLRGLRGR